MPEARPLSAITHWWNDRAAMFKAQDLRQRDGTSIAGEAERCAAGLQLPDAGDSGPGG